MAIPGSIVNVGKLVSPGGAAGPKGDAPSLADTTQNGLLAKVSGNTSDFIDGTNNCQPIAPQIWSARLRNFNAFGNPTFEVDQVNVGSQIVVGTGVTSKQCDRWYTSNVLAAGGPNLFGQQAAASNVVVPGTSYLISTKSMVLTFATQKVTLAATDVAGLRQIVEGPAFRELIGDVSSLSLLVATNVAGGLKFSVSIRDPSSTTKSLVKLCTIPTANTPTLIQLPNIPVVPAGNWSTAPGVTGAVLDISVAGGSTVTASAADTWQNGNFLGAPGADNFFAKPTSSTFTVYFAQWEPGPVCTTLIDKPFSQNLDECLRYFSKSFSYPTAIGTATTIGCVEATAIAAQHIYAHIPFKRVMAKPPTVGVYSAVGGGVGTVYDLIVGTNRAISGAGAKDVGDFGFGGVLIATQSASPTIYQFHYTADTGW